MLISLEMQLNSYRLLQTVSVGPTVSLAAAQRWLHFKVFIGQLEVVDAKHAEWILVCCAPHRAPRSMDFVMLRVSLLFFIILQVFLSC